MFEKDTKFKNGKPFILAFWNCKLNISYLDPNLQSFQVF
jgi:hypothetical protein